MAAPQPRQEVFSIKFVQAIVCECVATAIFIFIALGSSFQWSLEMPTILQRSMAFGLTMSSLYQVFGPVSGAHLNPAVSIAYFVGNQMSIIRMVVYIVLQLLGAIIGAGILYGVTPPDVRRTLFINELSYKTSPVEAMLVETILTFAVVMSILSATDKRRADNRGNPAMSIGTAVTMAHLMGMNYTGCSTNPARSFGPAIIMGTFSESHWVFWLGPIFGASMASIVYNYLLHPRAKSMEERMAILSGSFIPEDE